jgi:hypothetical protein
MWSLGPLRNGPRPPAAGHSNELAGSQPLVPAGGDRPSAAAAAAAEAAWLPHLVARCAKQQLVW